MSEWISVKVKLPKNKEIVLVITIFGEMAVCLVNVGVDCYIFMLNETNKQITDVSYWMPLPSPPEEK